jgi:hypothetical protein
MVLSFFISPYSKNYAQQGGKLNLQPTLLQISVKGTSKAVL